MTFDPCTLQDRIKINHEHVCLISFTALFTSVLLLLQWDQYEYPIIKFELVEPKTMTIC